MKKFKLEAVNQLSKIKGGNTTTDNSSHQSENDEKRLGLCCVSV